MEPRWTLRPVADEALVAQVSAALNGLPAPLARALVLRGVTTFDEARAFFRPALDGLHDPFRMRDMDRAAERLAQAVEMGERVLVYGDYDVDGTTSTALMTLFLRSLGVETTFFIPNRHVHGYGLCEAGLDEAVAFGARLVVALDCGITAVKEAAYAREKGLDLIIGDHHEPGATLPEATAVLDPKRADCAYPFDGLSGCGVGFKLVQATLTQLGLPPDGAWPLLDLVAVSIAGDIVPIVDENRVLMQAGLERLCHEPRIGLALLAKTAGVDLARCGSSQIVFGLAPRINAAGRLGDAGIAAELLMATDPARAAELVAQLDALNTQRRVLDAATRDEAMVLAEAAMASDPPVLVLHHEGWPGGILGITASRIAEHFHRPAVLLSSNGDGEARGSARSVAGVNLHEALARCAAADPNLLTRFGGHAVAAGLALPVAHVPALREALAAAVLEVAGAPRPPEIELDAPLGLDEITDKFWRIHEQFRPFGPHNLRPLFWGRDLRVVGVPKTVGADHRHLRLRVAQRDGGPSFPVIGFGLADRLDAVLASARRGRPLEAAFTVEENEWQGQTSLQLSAKDVRLADEAA